MKHVTLYKSQFKIIFTGHGVVVSVSAPCAEASALDAVVPSLTPVLAELSCMSSPHFSPCFYAVPHQIKAIIATKPYKNNLIQKCIHFKLFQGVFSLSLKSDTKARNREHSQGAHRDWPFV